MVSKQVGGPDNIHFSLCVDKLWGDSRRRAVTNINAAPIVGATLDF